MHNPLFYERQRMRASTWNIPRFLHSCDETLDGGLILPRGMLDTVTSLAAQAGSRLDVTDERAPGTQHELTFTATLTSVQRAAVTDLARHDLGVLVASLAKRAPGYTSLGFPDPRKLPYTPSASMARQAEPSV